MQFSAMNCACMSVGNAGYSLVRKLTAFGRPSALTRIQSCPRRPDSMRRRPRAACRSPRRGDRRARPAARTSPPAAATAHRNVPASMRSGTMRCSHAAHAARRRPGCGCWLVPSPSMRAPIVISTRPGRRLSGSCAAFSSTVSPSASVAAIIRFSVPVTVTMSVGCARRAAASPSRRCSRARRRCRRPSPAGP